MDSYIKNLNIVDLISEQHQTLRALARDMWYKKNSDYLTDTETHILAMIEIKGMTVAELSRIIHISRQGTHKCVQNLITKEYLKTNVIEGNNRDKLIVLTEKGKQVCTGMLNIKIEIENIISDNIGEEKLELLKIILRENLLLRL